MAIDPPSRRLIQGTVDILILQTLSAGANHGYGVSTWIRDRTDGELAIEDAALYQALHRLERKGLLDSDWGLSENNRRAKFYRLTARGHKQLEAEASNWRRYARAVFRVLGDLETTTTETATAKATDLATGVEL